MKMTKLYSPDGKAEVLAHPSSVESMISRGWTAEPAKKTAVKKTSKAEAVEEIIDPAPSDNSVKE